MYSMWHPVTSYDSYEYIYIYVCKHVKYYPSVIFFMAYHQFNLQYLLMTFEVKLKHLLTLINVVWEYRLFVSEWPELIVCDLHWPLMSLEVRLMKLQMSLNHISMHAKNASLGLIFKLRPQWPQFKVIGLHWPLQSYCLFCFDLNMTSSDLQWSLRTNFHNILCFKWSYEYTSKKLHP